jgi:RNA polymerase sigma-70 factor, ECF subfamily
MQLATEAIEGANPGWRAGHRAVTASQERVEEQTSLNDEQLVLKARSGDRTAFDQLIERHYRTCLNIALSILRNREDAEDEVQNACCKAFEKFGQYSGDGAFAAWLTRIVANESIVRYRQKRARRLHYLDEPLAQFNSAKLEIVDMKTLPDEALGSKELGDAVLHQVSCMPPLFREVISLRDVQQLPIMTVSKRLGITVPAAKSRLARARGELRLRFDRHFGPEQAKSLLQDGRPRKLAAVMIAG